MTFRPPRVGTDNTKDVLYGAWKAIKFNLLNLQGFTSEEYQHYERVE
jgi:hypothetical protein